MTQPDPQAPHGRGPDGTPLAPYGLNLDGTPRKSNRGARPGQKRTQAGKKTASSAAPTATMSNLSDEDRKGMLCELADSLVVAPLASASQVPFLASKIGAKQADALAGDAFILAHYFPGIADGLILLSKTKPATLAWLDKMEQNAPYVVLANALLQAGKAIAGNHINPNPSLASAGRSLAAIRMQAMADAVNAQAAAMRQGPAPAPMRDPSPEFVPPSEEQFEEAAARAAMENDPTLAFRR